MARMDAFRALRPLVPLIFRPVFDQIVAWMQATDQRLDALEAASKREGA